MVEHTSCIPNNFGQLTDYENESSFGVFSLPRPMEDKQDHLIKANVQC